MADYDKTIGGLNEGRSKRKVALAAGLLVLIVSFAFLGIVENGTTMTDRRSLLSNTGSSNNNHNSINADSAARTREMKGVNGKPATSSTSSAKTQNIHNIHNIQKKEHVGAVHEWKTSEENADIDADATERYLYRACPPGVDSVTGSFCGLSYEQICCFCPQPLDCDSTGCPADGDGIVRDGCFHSITIPCPDVDCSVDQMTDRAVELGK